MRDSRNYYTHYTKGSSTIWTPNQLTPVNTALRQLLKGALLKKLGLEDSLINKLLNNRAAYSYQDYEKNQYSLLFLSPGEED